MKLMLSTRVRIAFALLLLTAGIVPAASAQPLATSTFRVFVDQDPGTNSGCAATTTLGTVLSGIDQVVTITFQYTPAPTYIGVTRQVCSGGTFGSPLLPAPPLAFGATSGLGGSTGIETSIPIPSAPASGIRLYFDSVYTGGTAPTNMDELITLIGGQPIIVGGPAVPIPTLGEWGLVLLALLLTTSGFLVIRRRGDRRRAVAGMLLVVLGLGAGVAWAAGLVVDGNTSDWNAGNSTEADDSATPTAVPNADIVAGFGGIEGTTLFLRMDVKFSATPVSNRPPVVDAATDSIPENSPNGTNVGTPVTFTDPDLGQNHAFAITGGNTGGAFAIDPVSGQITVANAAALDFETTPTFSLTVQVTDDGTPVQSGTGTITVNLTDVNEAPVVDPATFAVPEHAANGTNVGTPVTFTDPDVGQTHTFSITAGNTGGAFAIDPSGQITVANSAAVDFPTNPTFSLTVQVTDDGTPALSGTATVTINVTDVNDAPVVDPATFSIPENSANGTNVGTPVTFTDADTGQTHTYSITAGNTGNAFAINAATGQITVATSSAVDFETTPTFSLTVQVTDDGTPALSGTATITINVTDVNEAPVVNAATFSLPENSPNGTNVGTPVTFTDQDTGQTHTFSITAGNTGGAFAINAATGQITVATASAINFETNPTFSLTVQVTDDGTPALSGTGTITVNLTDVNEAPAVNAATFMVAEHAANGTNVGTPVTFTDPDTGQTHTFSITAGNTGGAFAINAATGQITVATSAAVDFATNPTFSLTVQVTDNGTPVLSGTGTVTINVTDVNDPPVVNPATFSIPENSPNGTNVGTPVTFTDPDTGQTHTFSITAGNTGGAFTINAATGQVTVATSAAVNFEVTPTFSLTVQVTDNGTPVQSGTATVTINVTDVNEAPVVNPATFTIPENTANGTNVGTPVTFTDPDTGQAHTFSITAGNTGGAFAINAATGQITVANSTAVDFETNPTFTLTVQVTDNGTPVLSGTATVTINLTNVNEAPVVNPATFTIPENSANGTGVGTMTFTDPDTGQTHTFSITAGNTGGAFAINAATGQITVANSAVVDFETNPTFTLTVQVTDNGTPVLSGTASATINLTNVNEGPMVSPAAFTIPENTANGTNVGTPITFTDQDTGQTHTFSITAGNTGGAFTINAATGQITVANSAAVNFETTPSFTLTVQVTDNGTPALSGTASVTITVTDVNEAPVVNPATFSLPENSANGTSVGTVTFTDPETGQAHTFAIVAGNTGGAFAINAATGAITVANSAALDFETTPTFSLTVQVTDNGSPAQSGMAAITINLTNVNEAPVVNPATFAINENSPNGTTVGTVTFTDSDTGQTHTFAITAGNTGGAFAINAATGVITVANVGAVNFEVNPTFSLTVQVTDNGTPVLSGTATITINLNDVPEPPVANPDSFDTIGNTLLQVAASNTATGPHVFATGSLLANDVDQDVPSNLTTSLNAASPGAQVTVNSDGTFTYLPPPGAAGPTDTFTYNLTDGTFTVTGTVTITLHNRVWFVKNNAVAGGLGRSADPFDTLVEAQTASSANDYIFVFLGDGTNTGQNAGIVLKAGQHLLGEHFGLTVAVPGPGTFNGTALPTNVGLVTAVSGNRPLIDNSAANGNAVSATDVIPAEVNGFSLAGNATGGNAVDWTTTGAFAGTGTFSIQNNVIRSAGAEGIDVNAGGTGTLTLGITNNSWNAAGAHTGNAVDIARTGGLLRLDFSNNTGILSSATAVNINGGAIASTTITGFANNSVHQNTVGTGISVANAKFDNNASTAGYETVSGGTTVVGASGNGVGGSGVVLSNVSGDLAFTDLDIFADGGAGLRVTGTGAVNTGAGTGTRVTVGAGVAIFEAIGGPAVDVTNTTIDLQPTSIKSTNSPTTGVSLDTIGGTFSAGSGSSISNSTGTAFNVNAGTATISYDGPITNSAGRSVSVTSKTSGSTTFNGTIAATGGTGIFLNGNTGSTISFTKQISLTTGASDAFTATGGGTVTSTDTTSTLTTTTGTALNVANTTIGVGGLKFATVSAGTAASGPANGIVLNNTGAGGLTISGGTIQKTTSNGISLTTTGPISLSSMTIKNSTHLGISGTGLAGFTLSNSSVLNNGTSANVDHGIQLLDVSGTATFTNDTVTGSHVTNLFFGGTVSSTTVTNLLTVSGGTYGNSATNTGIQVNMTHTSMLKTALFSGVAFSSNASSGLQVVSNDNAIVGDGVGVPATGTVTVSGCTFTNNAGNTAMDIDQGGGGGAGQMYARLINNATITGNGGPAINIFTSSSSTGGTMKVRIDGNHVGNAAVSGSGTTLGPGIRVFLQGKTTNTVTIANNVVRQTLGSRAIDVEALGPVTTGQPLTVSDVVITGNDAATNDTTPGGSLAAIYVAADNQGSPAQINAEIHGNTIPTGGDFDYPTFDGNAPWLYYRIATSGAVAKLFNFGAHANANSEIQLTQTSGTAGADITNFGGVQLTGVAVNSIP